MIASFWTMKKLVCICLITVCASSCSFFKPKIAPYPGGVIFPLAKAQEISYKGRIISRIQKEGEILYFSTTDGSVICVQGKSQKILWQLSLSSSTLSSSPSLGQQSVYVYDQKNILYSVSKDGKLRWARNVEEEITSGIEEIDNSVYFGTASGTLISLDRLEGKNLWSFQAGKGIRTNLVDSGGLVCFGSDDGRIYLLDKNGTLLKKIKVNGHAGANLLSEGQFLYFGTDEPAISCLDLKTERIKWQVKTGAEILSPPVIQDKRLYFFCWNSVLYCLNKKSGEIQWWQAMPSRSPFALEVVEDKVVAASLSPVVVSFDRITGKNLGNYDAGQEIKSNPLWIEPYLLISLYNQQTGMGTLVFLKKEVKASLESSKLSPQKIDEEVVFTAAATGFYRPQFEFFLEDGGKKDIVQERSEKKIWTWFPSKEGTYKIIVVAVDEKEQAEAEISYVIEAGKEEEKKDETKKGV